MFEVDDSSGQSFKIIEYNLTLVRYTIEKTDSFNHGKISMAVILEILVSDNKILFLLDNNFSFLGIKRFQMILGGNSIRIV